MEQYLEEQIESAIWAVFVCAYFRLVPNHILLFTSHDKSGTQNMKSPATKTSTWDTSSALSCSENFILPKNWSQDPLFVVTSFLSNLSMSSEFYTGHAFHMFKLIFSVVTSFVLLSEEKYKKKKSKNPKKTTIAQK